MAQKVSHNDAHAEATNVSFTYGYNLVPTNSLVLVKGTRTLETRGVWKTRIANSE